jgi:hypothetical protein
MEHESVIALQCDSTLQTLVYTVHITYYYDHHTSGSTGADTGPRGAAPDFSQLDCTDDSNDGRCILCTGFQVCVCVCICVHTVTNCVVVTTMYLCSNTTASIVVQRRCCA